MRTRSAVAIALALLASPAGAAVPSEFSVQGVLRNSTGALQTMPVNVTVTLFDSQAMTNLLAGPYVMTNVPTTSGLFTTSIADAALQTKLGGAAQVWLQVTAGNDTFQPQLITPQLYALMCAEADAASSFNGPLLDVVASNALAGEVNVAARFRPTSTSAGVIIGTVNGNAPYIADDPNGGSSLGLRFRTANTDRVVISEAGSVGIGTTSPGIYHIVGGRRALTISSTGTSGNDTGTLELATNATPTMATPVGLGEISFLTTATTVNPFATIASNTEGNGGGNDFGGVLTFSTKGDNGTQALERMRISSTGNVGVGLTNPLAPLDVYNGIRGSFGTSPAAQGFDLGWDEGVGNGLGEMDLHDRSGSGLGGFNFYINPDGGSQALVATIASNGTYTPSDARLKENVRPIDGALDGVERLRGVRFTWKKDGQASLGVIAQEVEKVYPELVSTQPDGMKMVDYSKLTAVLIESTKALKAENAALKARLDRIEARLDRRAAR